MDLEPEPGQERARRVHDTDDWVTEAQEEAGLGPGIREGAAEIPKAFRDAYEPPADYPRPVMVHPEDFRNGPIRAGHDAVSPGYEPPLQFPAPPEPGPPGLAWSTLQSPSPGPYVEE